MISPLVLETMVITQNISNWQGGGGVRQGCPISALLLLIMAEIIVIKLRQNNNMKDLTVQNKYASR